MKKILLVICAIMSVSLYSQNNEFEIFNTSVNSKFAELGVTYLTDNTVIFASSKKDNEDGRRKNNRQLHLQLFHGSIAENGDIIQTGNFSTEINNKYFESDISFTPDLKTIYFTWNNFYNTESIQDSAKWKTLYLFKATINSEFQLSNITPFPYNSKKYSIRNPQVSYDGKKLFFVSDMPGGYGGLDIYYVDILGDGLYGNPINLGSEINSKLHELYPFVDSNNTLYFSSYGQKGFGSLDIYKSEFKDNAYQPIELLPKPINSSDDDFAFVINAEKQTGYFTSNRKGGIGDVDIYAFKLKEIKEEIIACNQFITGLFFDKNTSEQLDNVQASLYKNDTLVTSSLVGLGEKYRFDLDCNQSFKIIAEKPEYEAAVYEFKTDNTHLEEIRKSLTLKPLVCNQNLIALVVDSKTNEPLPNAHIEVFKNNVLETSFVANTEGKFDYKLDCNNLYRITAQLPNYTQDITVIQTTFKPNEILERKFVLESNVEFVTVREQKMINTNPIYFALDKSDIQIEAAIELDKVVAILNKYPTIKLEIKSHTDSRAPDSYNLRLSNDRAKSTINYILSKGIDSNRISGKGYGETELVNKCTNGVPCSEAEHALNRRTEFIVIDE